MLHFALLISWVHDIFVGDQAEIVFTLMGEPPFTFTYQRAELSTKKGVQGKVLETHTVSGVTTKEYSIFSALEGSSIGSPVSLTQLTLRHANPLQVHGQSRSYLTAIVDTHPPSLMAP